MNVLDEFYAPKIYFFTSEYCVFKQWACCLFIYVDKFIMQNTGSQQTMLHTKFFHTCLFQLKKFSFSSVQLLIF